MCEVEKIILKRHVAVYPFLEEIDCQMKDCQYYVSDKQIHKYSLGKIEGWSNLKITDKIKISVP